VLERYPHNWYEYVRLAMHRQGINLRYLGSVRRLVPAAAAEFRRVLLTEMVVRTLRTMLDSAMRTKKKKRMGAKAITRFYAGGDARENHKSIGEDERRKTFWCSFGEDGIKPELLRKYPEALSAEEEADHFDLREAIDVPELARRLPPHSLRQPQGIPLNLPPRSSADR
jgi:hypothetical protein